MNAGTPPSPRSAGSTPGRAAASVLISPTRATLRLADSSAPSNGVGDEALATEALKLPHGPQTPRRLRLEAGDKEVESYLLGELAERLAPLGVDVATGDVNPALEVLRSLAEHLGGGVPAWLADAPDEEGYAFVDAAHDFFDAAPWHHFESDRFIAYRVGEGPWRCASVMGQAGEEFGLGVFRSHLDAVAFHAAPGADRVSAAQRLRAIGWFESLSLCELETLSPLDARRYLEARTIPSLGAAVPGWLRFEPDGPAVPEQTPGVYAALLALLTDAAQRAKGLVEPFAVTRETPAGPLQVVYPATGEESAARARVTPLLG